MNKRVCTLIAIIAIVLIVIILIISILRNNHNGYDNYNPDESKDDQIQSSIVSDIENKIYTSMEEKDYLEYMYQGEIPNINITVLHNAGNEIVAKSALCAIENYFDVFTVDGDEYADDVYRVKFTANGTRYILMQSMDAIEDYIYEVQGE